MRSSFCPTCQETRKMKLERDDKLYCVIYKNNPSVRGEPIKLSDGVKENLESMLYEDYLQTSHWKALREQAMKKSGDRCQICNQSCFLQVHHRTYKHRGDAMKEIDDLIVCCRDCHEMIHENVKII